MSTPSTPPDPTGRFGRLLPRGRAWWIVAGAFAAGLLLFLLLLSSKRDAFEFYRADGDAGRVEGQVFEPLPAPLPAGDEAAIGMDQQPPGRADAPRIDQHTTPAATGPSAGAPAAPVAGATSVVPGAAGVPRPLSSPAPAYPRAALRTGASGDVVLRIEVGVDGVPTSVEIERSSRHRELDRAAVQAVRRWRFQPAMRDGIPVPATVQQVISFEPPR